MHFYLHKNFILVKSGCYIDQRVQEYDQQPPVPHGDTVGHSVHSVPLCTFLDFSTLFTSDGSSVNLHVPQIHS
jgi:hypothetical protein